MRGYGSGNALRARREGIGLTQAEFARRVNADRTTVSNWETGRYAPKNYAKMMEIAAVLGVKPEHVMRWFTADKRGEYRNGGTSSRVIRATHDEWRLIGKAAAAAGMGLGQWLLDVALEYAEQYQEGRYPKRGTKTWADRLKKSA